MAKVVRLNLSASVRAKLNQSSQRGDDDCFPLKHSISCPIRCPACNPRARTSSLEAPHA
jgi:hypothetical protein